MFDEFIKRENTIFEILQAFVNSSLEFIVIGGYGISAYKHRFSTDVDIIIKVEDKIKFQEILKKGKFVKTITKDLDHTYTSEFIRYETIEKPSASIDLLINGVGSRTTNASFSFQEIKNYSKKREIIGSEKEVTCLVPDKEILIVLKTHSGRLTDFRDVVAVSKDINIKLIESLIWRGKKEIVKENIKKLLSLINDKGFIDSFKGVFIEKKYDLDLESLNRLKELLK